MVKFPSAAAESVHNLHGLLTKDLFENLLRMKQATKVAKRDFISRRSLHTQQITAI